MQILKAADPSIREQLKQFEQQMAGRGEIAGRVTAILEDVRNRGDEALFELTRKFDGVELTAKSLKVTAEELEAGFKSLSVDDIANIKRAKSQIEDYHRNTIPTNWTTQNADGACVGERFYPIQSVGLYVPGGNVPLVSSVLMSAVLAKLAGNPRIVVVTPPLPNGSVAKGMLAALRICGITEIYKVGGAQAIAALAYGTQTITAVDKVFGPGNAYVLEAKRQVFGQVGVDLLPGPSEVAIVADETATPAWVAADLLAQAEHGSGKERVILLASSEEILSQIKAEVELQTPARTHADAITKVITERCLWIVFDELLDAVAVLNQFAPEHLELQVGDDSIDYLTRYVNTAGAMLLGHHTPTVLGDFVAGPSHTLPTGGAGRFMSGMRLTDYLRRTSVLRYKPGHLKSAAPVVRTFSRLEQLDAHGHSLEIRLS